MFEVPSPSQILAGYNYNEQHARDSKLYAIELTCSEFINVLKDKYLLGKIQNPQYSEL